MCCYANLPLEACNAWLNNSALKAEKMLNGADLKKKKKKVPKGQELKQIYSMKNAICFQTLVQQQP